MPPFAGVFIF